MYKLHPDFDRYLSPVETNNHNYDKLVMVELWEKYSNLEKNKNFEEAAIVFKNYQKVSKRFYARVNRINNS